MTDAMTSADPLSVFLEHLQTKVDSVLQVTESATLSLGENLSNIVDESRTYVSEIGHNLDSVSGGGDVSAILERQVSTVDEFIDSMRGTVSEQEQVAGEVLSTTQAVIRAAESISAVSSKSKMLALNTMVEAVRMEKGSAFKVIAEEMRDLADMVSETNSRITDLATSLIPVLATIEENVSQMQGRMDGFAGDLAEQREDVHEANAHLKQALERTLSSGDERLANIIEVSQQAIVHLQFQDPITQSLRGILREADAVHRTYTGEPLESADGDSDIYEMMRGTNGILSSELEDQPDDGSLGSGEMMMF